MRDELFFDIVLEAVPSISPESHENVKLLDVAVFLRLRTRPVHVAGLGKLIIILLSAVSAKQYNHIL